MNKENLVKRAYEEAYEACKKFDSRWAVSELKRNNIWFKALHNPETLPLLLYEILSEAREDAFSECLLLEKSRKKWMLLGTQEYAYRIVAYALKGWPPKDRRSEVVRHTCGNALCVHPEHLQIGTHRENIQDEKLHKSKRLMAKKVENTGGHLVQGVQPKRIGQDLVKRPSLRVPSGRKPKKRDIQ